LFTSAVKSAQEILLPPLFISWRAHKIIDKNSGKDKYQ